MNRSTPITRMPRAARCLQLTPMALSLLAAMPALAQQAPAADTGKLETVTITATKRVQPLQTTPIAISVISGGALEESNLNNLEAISAQVPTVNFRTNASNKDATLFIRGIGTVSTAAGVEPTVSTVLDGVVAVRPGQSTLDLAEIERIEVLRGPQGTLFGKNASAGVINIVTRAPGKQTAGYVDLAYFEGQEKRIRLGVSGELVKDLVRGSISALAGDFKGNVTNIFDGSTVNGYDRKGVRGRLDVTPGRDLKISLIADRVEAKDTPTTGVPYATAVTTYPTGVVTQNPLYGAAVAPMVPSPTNRQINSDMKTRVADVNQGISAQVDWGMGAHQLTSITALRQWENHQFQDQDRMGELYRGFNRTADEGQLDFEQISQELRIASTQKGFIEYVAGLFYIQGSQSERYQRSLTRCAASTQPALPSGLVPCTPASTTVETGEANFGVKSKGASIFGEGTINFAPTMRAIAGLRYTSDELSYNHRRVSSSPVFVPGLQPTRARVDGSTSEKAVSGRIGPQFDLGKDSMAYATYSRGYKGPAFNVFFNMQPREDNVIAPEKSNSYELGMKNTLLDGRVRLNVAAFKTDYTGYQADASDVLGGVIITRLINAGDVSTKGVEVDMQARLTPRLSLSSGLAHTKARIKNFNCPPGAAVSCDVNGRPLPFAPDWKASLRLKYTQPLSGSLTLEYGVDGNWQSKTNFSIVQQPDSVQKSYAIVNATLALQSTAGWRLALLAKNLADESYATLIQSGGNHINRYVPRDDQRYFGVNFRYDF